MPDKATLYHNPRCSKSRAALELLNQRGLNVTTVEYLKTTLDATTIKEIALALGLKPREMMRPGEAIYKELNLSDNTLTEQQLIDAMVSHPILIERPIVVTADGAAIGRPIDQIIELLDH